MLACSNGHKQIAFELFKWHEVETLDSSMISNFYNFVLKSIDQAKLNGFIQLSDDLKQLIFDLETRRTSPITDRKCSLSSPLVVLSSNPSSSSSPSELVINYQDSKLINLPSHPSNSHLAVEHSIIDDFHLIENLDDLNSLLLTDDPNQNNLCALNDEQPQHALENTEINANDSELLYVSKVVKPVITDSISYILNQEPHVHQEDHISDENDNDYHNLFASFENTIVNIDDNCLNGLVGSDLNSNNGTALNKKEMDNQSINTNENLSTILQSPPPSSQLILPLNIMPPNNVSSSINIGPPPPQPTSSSTLVDDDQDKKIKTLADNIIAAMPHKIKTNSYSTIITQQQSNYKNYSVNSNCNKINGNYRNLKFRSFD